jgi:dTDP-4-amino-4,6-dideoxygalactose transaminase
MWWRDLPPAGNPIEWRGSSQALPVFQGYRAFYVNSGTAALALALIVARARHPTIDRPEVILPGYACPDLVAAAVYAGLTPVLADIGANDPGYDLISLQQVLSDRVVAVVAVNFLGIRERLSQLQECLLTYPQAMLIEDNAQWFPEPLPDAPLTRGAVCLSFGRGKPVSLLGGGALLLDESLEIPDTFMQLADTQLTDTQSIAPAQAAGRLYLPKVLAYNALLNPNLYGLISRNRWIKLGRTVFKPLLSISALDETRKALLPANVGSYLRRSRDAEYFLQQALPTAVDFCAHLNDRRGRLLRYPVLCESAQQREKLLAQLQAAGLGASAMYRQMLPTIEGVEGRVVVRVTLNGSRVFAQRLLTLPLHAGVRSHQLQQMATILAAVET